MPSKRIRDQSSNYDYVQLYFNQKNPIQSTTLSQAYKLENVMPMEETSIALPKDILKNIISKNFVGLR
jgi:hypothetical protein